MNCKECRFNYEHFEPIDEINRDKNINHNHCFIFKEKPADCVLPENGHNINDKLHQIILRRKEKNNLNIYSLNGRKVS